MKKEKTLSMVDEKRKPLKKFWFPDYGEVEAGTLEEAKKLINKK